MLPRKLNLEELVKLLGLSEEEISKIQESFVTVPKNRKREEVESFKWSEIIKYLTSNKKVRTTLKIKEQNLLGPANLFLSNSEFEDRELDFSDEPATTGGTRGLKNGNEESHG